MPMSDFAVTWSLVRGRFLSSLEGLTTEGINRRLHPGTLTIGEMTLHVAGVEISFATQLLGETPEGLAARLKRAATDGVVNDLEFPFTSEEITPELLSEAMELARAKVQPMIGAPDAYRANEIVSALGPRIDGTGAFARLAYHPAYHHAQVYMIRTAPGFPA
jgi:hypothetical protein